jgi:hypothetical protein
MGAVRLSLCLALEPCTEPFQTTGLPPSDFAIGSGFFGNGDSQFWFTPLDSQLGSQLLGKSTNGDLTGILSLPPD